MRAVVLVGGFGTRLRPLTATIPKPMLPVAHRPIIDHLLADLAGGGVDDATLALGFRPEPFLQAYPEGVCSGVQLHYAIEPEPLDTAGAIRFAANERGIAETFVVGNGDILCDVDVAALVAEHRRRGALATIHLISVDDPSAFGVVDIDADGRIRRFVEKPAPGTAPSTLVNAGTYVLEPEVLELIPPGRRVSIEREIFPQLAANGSLIGVATDDYWIDTGRPETYLQANLDLLDGRRPGRRVEGVARDAAVAVDAVVVDAVVGGGATVGAGARVERSVLLPGASVGAGATVRESLVMGHVGAQATIERVVVGVDGIVDDGERLTDVRRPES